MTPWVRRLLLLNVVVFLAQGFLPYSLMQSLWFVPALVLVQPWTVITYQFLHANFIHILANMIGLFFFGPRVEMRIGSRHFLFLYLVSGIGGAVLSFMTPYTAVIGASGAVFGVLLGFARYWPRERIYIYGIIPIEARILVIFAAVFSLWSGFSGGGNIAHFAHLGGFAGGWLYLAILERRSPARRFKKELEASMQGSRPSGRDLKRWELIDRARLHPINQAEFDRVLRKARESGVSALNAQERAFMQRLTGST